MNFVRASNECQSCGLLTATEHPGGWDAVLCSDCQVSLGRVWQRSQRLRELVSLVLVSAFALCLLLPAVHANPLWIAVLVLAILLVILWDGRTFKSIDERCFVRRQY